MGLLLSRLISARRLRSVAAARAKRFSVVAWRCACSSATFSAARWRTALAWPVARLRW
nr:MAG TPA: hypothetical protein [Caudoviricetes sp.]